jgi:hypothetical protein
MYLQDSKKTILLQSDEKLTISVVQNPLTEKRSFLVESSFWHQALITDNLIIDDVEVVLE